MTIKDRLLEAIGDMPDLSQDVLTDILIEKVEMLRAELAAARDAVFQGSAARRRHPECASCPRGDPPGDGTTPSRQRNGDFFFADQPQFMWWRSAAGG